jgi:integrase/recombinase XerD
MFETSRKIRMQLPFQKWPAEDRIGWESAFKIGDRFDESGPGAHLAESTRRVWRESYSRFLGFISAHRPDLMHLPPDARIDRLVVADYVAWRRKSCGDVSVAIDLDHLRGALKLICPGVDWSWLLIITKRIAAAAPRRHPKYHLVTSDRLYALGLELMDSALTEADAAKRISKAHAFQYRDGLIIALRALIPLRSRTVVAMRIGSHLVKTGDLWGLDIPAADTKNKRPLDYPIPMELSARIDLYLERFRSRIPGAERHTGVGGPTRDVQCAPWPFMTPSVGVPRKPSDLLSISIVSVTLPPAFGPSKIQPMCEGRRIFLARCRLA